MLWSGREELDLRLQPSDRGEGRRHETNAPACGCGPGFVVPGLGGRRAICAEDSFSLGSLREVTLYGQPK